MKLPYDAKYLCPQHKDAGEIAATCKRCHSLALGQQRRQWEAQRDKAHAQYLATLRKAA